MSRAPRIEVADGVYHVVARGNERKALFKDTVDRERFLEILELTIRRFRWQLLAYCLMTNHYHALVQTPEPNLARGMRQLNGAYAQTFNRRHGRDGHLFQGRYQARLVQTDEHLLSAVCYVVRNPLRARICERLEEWPWSSHHATIGTSPPGLVAVDVLLSHFGRPRQEGRARYRELVEIESASRPAHPIIDGDEGFIAMHLECVRPSPEYPRAHLTPPRRPLHELVTTSADVAGVAHAYLQHGYSMREIATHLGCGIATVHRRVRRHEAELQGTWKT